MITWNIAIFGINYIIIFKINLNTPQHGFKLGWDVLKLAAV